jgi:hypothetical protein
MNNTSLEVMRVLFNEGEYAAFGQTVYDVRNVCDPFQTVAQKPLPVYTSLNPIMRRTTKCDANVSTLRNFLFEIDSMPLIEQIGVMEGKGVPYSVITYSGGKSYHFVLSLEEELPLDLWEHYMTWIHRALPFIDHAPKAESVWTRYPEAIRPDTGRVQEVETITDRMPLGALRAALLRLIPEPEITAPLGAPKTIPVARCRLPLTTLARIEGHYSDHARNHELFVAAISMYERGWQEVEIHEALLTNFPFDATFEEREFNRTIKSAISSVNKQVARAVIFVPRAI